MKHTVKVFLCVTAYCFFPGCKSSNTETDESPAIKTRVTYVNPAYRNISEYIQCNGITQYQKKDNIRATVTGYVTSLSLRPGDYIEKGRDFCNIITKEQEALKQMQPGDTLLDRFRAPLTLKSNASGIITSVTVVEGDYVSEGDVVANVNDPSSLIVRVNVPYEYTPFLSKGKSCMIYFPDGKTREAAIAGILPSIDAASQSQDYFIRIPGQSIPENLNVIVRVEKKKNPACLSVPSGSIQTNEMQDQFWVMKIVNDSYAVKIPVRPGLQNDSFTEIRSENISAGDEIISRGAYGLADSTLVTRERQ
jgi:biotin carboxyl carrier protein